jgi:hypothetical protein
MPVQNQPDGQPANAVECGNARTARCLTDSLFQYFHCHKTVKFYLKISLLLFLGLGVNVDAQNVRYDAPFPSISSSTVTPFLVANVPPNAPVLALCSSPANALPTMRRLILPRVQLVPTAHKTLPSRNLPRVNLLETDRGTSASGRQPELTITRCVSATIAIGLTR